MAQKRHEFPIVARVALSSALTHAVVSAVCILLHHFNPKHCSVSIASGGGRCSNSDHVHSTF